MSDQPLDEIRERLFTVGLICAQWAYLEYLLAATIWVVLGVSHDAGKIVTGTLDMKGRTAMATRLARQLGKPPTLINALAATQKDTELLQDERNLIVHGVGELRPDGRTYYEVHRGSMRDAPQHISLIRVHSLASAIEKIVGALEAVLLQHKIIEK